MPLLPFASAAGGGSGTVTSVATTAPLAGGTITTTGTLSITGVSGAVLAGSTPAFTVTPTLGVQNTTQGTLTVAGSAASAGTISLNIAGAAANPLVIQPGANAGTVTLTGPTTGGTIPSTATAPVTLSAAGAIGLTVHGNGSAVQLSDTTGTSGNLAKFDASGNVTDGGGTFISTGITTLFSNVNAASQSFTANKLGLLGFYLPCAVTTSTLVFGIGTADGVNNSSFGIYNSSGVLLLYTDAAVYGSTGTTTKAWHSSATLQPGKYYFGWTSAAGTIVCKASNAIFTFYTNANSGNTTSGGSVVGLGNITPPADSWGTSAPFSFGLA